MKLKSQLSKLFPRLSDQVMISLSCIYPMDGGVLKSGVSGVMLRRLGMTLFLLV